jgi:hypothetical protein
MVNSAFAGVNGKFLGLNKKPNINSAFFRVVGTRKGARIRVKTTRKGAENLTLSNFNAAHNNL